MEVRDKVTIQQVDMLTANKFTNTRKLKTWLRNHPNFEKDGDKWKHIYDDESAAWIAEQLAKDTVETTEQPKV